MKKHGTTLRLASELQSFFFPLKIYFSFSVLRDWNGLAEGTSICYGTPGPSFITPINLNGSHKAQPPHLDGNIPLLMRDQLHSGLPDCSGSFNIGVSVMTLEALGYRKGRTDKTGLGEQGSNKTVSKKKKKKKGEKTFQRLLCNSC